MKENFFRRTYTFILDEDKNIVLDKLATLFEEQYDYWIDRYNSHVSRESFNWNLPSLIYSGAGYMIKVFMRLAKQKDWKTAGQRSCFMYGLTGSSWSISWGH